MNITIPFQRIEAALIFLAATTVYFHSHFNWVLYVLLLFSFDIFAAGYLVNTHIGAIMYNIGHSMALPSLLIIIDIFHNSGFILGFGIALLRGEWLVWFAYGRKRDD